MKLTGSSNDIVGIFKTLSRDNMEIYRESCDARWDRKTGKKKHAARDSIPFCGTFKPRAFEIIQDSGAERARARATIIAYTPLYTTDQRDNASADIVMARGNYWKVMEVIPYCSYWKARVELMHQDECDRIFS